jgi:hypothetical protein
MRGSLVRLATRGQLQHNDRRRNPKKKEAIEAEHGPWTAYNINLGHEIQTAPQFADNLED